MEKYPHGFWEDGTRKFSVDALFKLVQGRAPTEVPIQQIIRKNVDLQSPEGNFRHNLQNPTPEFEARALRADTTFPVLLSPEGWIVDGSHRIAKLRWQGATRVWAHILSNRDLAQARVDETEKLILPFGDWKKSKLF